MLQCGIPAAGPAEPHGEGALLGSYRRNPSACLTQFVRLVHGFRAWCTGAPLMPEDLLLRRSEAQIGNLSRAGTSKLPARSNPEDTR